MKSNKLFAAVLIIISLLVFYIGIGKVSANTETIKFLGIRIDASNESGQTEGFIYLGIALILFIGGIYALGKSTK